MKNFNFFNATILIIFAVVLRLLPHPANVAPIAAMALFGGAYLDKKYAIILPLLAMIISDFFLGFNQSTSYVYTSFILIGCIGIWLKSHKTLTNVLLGTLLSSVLFFLITNFGFWLAFDLYPKTFAGQLQAYVMALPFFRNTLLGDFFYTGLFFGSYELIMHFFTLAYANLHTNRR